MFGIPIRCSVFGVPLHGAKQALPTGYWMMYAVSFQIKFVPYVVVLYSAYHASNRY